jgi:hypothetical protein
MDRQDVSPVWLLHSILPTCHPDPHRLTSRVSHCSPLLPGENSAPDLASDDEVLIPHLQVPPGGHLPIAQPHQSWIGMMLTFHVLLSALSW